jgi:hypothetical protein
VIYCTLRGMNVKGFTFRQTALAIFRVLGLDSRDGNCSLCRKDGKPAIFNTAYSLKPEVVHYVLGFTIWGRRVFEDRHCNMADFLCSQNCVCQRLALAVFLILFGSQLDS